MTDTRKILTDAPVATCAATGRFRRLPADVFVVFAGAAFCWQSG